MKLFTIGFTQKPAERFFQLLKTPGVKRLIDIRLNNVSQLAGFAKKDDLRFFARVICDLDYLHLPELAPTAGILDAYKKQKQGDWAQYERAFIALMRERQIETTVSPETLDGACLLCSEDKPDRCHRRLVAEYLRDRWQDVHIHHLV